MLPQDFVKNSTDALVPANVFRIIELVFDLGLALIFILIGLCTNYFNIRVFLKQDLRRSPVNVTLLALAVSDFCVSVLALLYRISYVLELTLEREDFEYWYQKVVILFGGAQLAVARVGYSMTALLSVERWISVTFPLRAKRWLTFRKLVCMTVFLVLLNLLLLVPAALVVGMRKTHNPQSNQSEYVIEVLVKHGGRVNDVSAKYILYAALIVIPSICTWTVVACTISIIITLRKAQTWRRTMESSVNRFENSPSPRESRLVKALLTILIIFIVCEVPMTSWGYQQTWVPNINHNLQVSLLMIVVCLETINSSVNFFVYITFYTSFKETFKKMYPCFWKFGCGSMSDSSSCCSCFLILSCRCRSACCVKSRNTPVTLQYISSSLPATFPNSNDSDQLQRDYHSAKL